MASNGNVQMRDELTQIQEELHDALHTLMQEVGTRLKPKERAEIEDELNELDALLDRLKSGFVWVAIYGKTSVGKSALVNAIIESDEASVDIEYDHTGKSFAYRHDPWMIVDMPGFMGDPDLEKIAIDEAKRAHGHVFIIDSEPLADEIEMFDIVYDACPDAPRIVFFNKADNLQHMPKKDREKVMNRVYEKMSKYVQNKEDIVFGSASLFDCENDVMVRQNVPQLIERMYESAGTLGMIMNILDPAGRAGDISDRMREKVSQIRMNIGRRIAAIFGALEVGGALIPLSTLITTPSLLTSLAFVLMKIMGKKVTKSEAAKIGMEGLKTCGTVLAGDFAAVAVASIVMDSMNFLGPVGSMFAALGNVAGLGWWRYRRTVIFAEVMLEFAKRDFSWGGEDKERIIQECKERALEFHMKFKSHY